ncbi:MAG: ABC transporter permease [Chitinivibrionales bacterium]
MKTLFLIAVNTFRETIRNQVLYNILLFAIVIIVLSVSFGDWSVFARVQVMQDFGLATMSVSGLLLAVFIGVGLLGREVASKTVYGLATKPVRRWNILLGKFSGLMGTLMLNFFIMTLCFIGAIVLIGGETGGQILLAVLLIWIEMALIVAVSLFFSTFTSPSLAAILTFGFYIAGHFNNLTDTQFVHSEMSLYWIVLNVIYFLMPNLEHLNIRADVIYGNGVTPGFVLYAGVYGILYTILFLFLSSVTFSRKDL